MFTFASGGAWRRLRACGEYKFLTRMNPPGRGAHGVPTAMEAIRRVSRSEQSLTELDRLAVFGWNLATCPRLRAISFMSFIAR